MFALFAQWILFEFQGTGDEANTNESAEALSEWRRSELGRDALVMHCLRQASTLDSGAHAIASRGSFAKKSCVDNVKWTPKLLVPHFTTCVEQYGILKCKVISPRKARAPAARWDVNSRLKPLSKQNLKDCTPIRSQNDIDCCISFFRTRVHDVAGEDSFISDLNLSNQEDILRQNIQHLGEGRPWLSWHCA